jgi:hypothetical protein
MSKNNSRYNLQKLVDKLKEYEYVVRFEKGNFKSGYCILADKKVVIINKFHDIDSRVENLRLILSEIRSEVLIDA